MLKVYIPKLEFGNETKSRPNHDRVVKASELTEDRKCTYFKELEEKEKGN